MTPTTSETRVHHPYSPSSLQCREACPKFEQRGGPVHEMALTGTKQHDSVDSGIDDPDLPDYRAMAVAECIRMTEERVAAFPGGTILREVYLPIDDEVVLAKDGTPFHGTTAGYLDFGIVSADGKMAEIIDWKFGNNAVEEARNNVQGSSYALGILKRFPNLDSIKVTFIMPHADYVSTHTFTRSDFSNLLTRIVTIVRRSELATRSPGDFSMAVANSSSCRFCGHVARCTKVLEKVISVGRKYAPLEIPDDITPTLISDPAQTKLGMGLADIVSLWATAYKKQASEKTLEDERFIPDGYTLVSTTKRKVTDARKLGELAKTYLPEEDRPKVDLLYDVAIGKLEKLVSTAAPRGQKDSTVEDFGLAALAEGSLEMGQPYAFLRQSRKDEGKTALS